MARRHVSMLESVVTFAALLGLTTLSFAASRLDLGRADVVVALVIACAKTTLVMLFFMHLVEQRFANRLIPIISILLLVILTGLVAADVASRHTFPKAPAPPISDQSRVQREY